MRQIFLAIFLFVGLHLQSQKMYEPGFEASCLNFDFREFNCQLYLDLKGESFALEDGQARLQIEISVRKAGSAFVEKRKVMEETPFFGPKLELPEILLNYPLRLEPGLYSIGVEVRDQIFNRIHFREIAFRCADQNQADFSWSDINLLRNSELIPEEAVTTVIGDILPPATTKIRFIAEARGIEGAKLTANVVLFRRNHNPGAIHTLRFTSLSQVSQALTLEDGNAQFSHQFEMDSLSSGEYLVEIYLYREKELVATQSRTFVLVWRGLDGILQNLEEVIPEMALVTDQANIDSLLGLKGKAREKAFLNFWSLRNSPQAQAPTDALESYFERINYIKTHFQEDLPGWKTDRGKIWFFYGKPDKISSSTYRGAAIETWEFKQWALKFVFVRKGNNFVRIDPGNLSHL
ncbi:MAG: GWxTD domain-containing protein [Bacteroidia bacterium]|nr:GWxTD domain-containing protein [Bacteroidia bacterium]